MSYGRPEFVEGWGASRRRASMMVGFRPEKKKN